MHPETLTPEHFDRIKLQPSQRDEYTADDIERLKQCYGWAAVDSGGEVFAIFVLPQIAPGRVAAFTLLSENLGRRRLAFAARHALDYLYGWGDFRRCEAYVLEDKPREIYWCWKVLGMKLEGKLRSFVPDGRSCYVFSVIRESSGAGRAYSGASGSLTEEPTEATRMNDVGTEGPVSRQRELDLTHRPEEYY